MAAPERPSVLFVCVKNGGKSQMAAGLMRQQAGDTVQVDSAGTRPGAEINALSAQSLLEQGVDVRDQRPKQLTPELVAESDLVVVLGTEARVEPVDGTPVRVWETDEPSERGIEGMERMRLVRDDIAARVRALAAELAPAPDGSAPDGSAPDGPAPDGSAPDGPAPDGSAGDAPGPDAPATAG